VVNDDAPLGQQLFDISIGEFVAQVPANREHDHIWWEPKPRETGVER
jgi:hypothetical protein